MINQPHRIHRTASAVAVLGIAGALALTSCGHSPHTPPPAPLTTTAAPATPAPAGVDDRIPDQVLAWVAAQVYSWRPAEDTSTAAGFGRAAASGLLDPVYVRQVGATASGLAFVTGATWDRWAAENATVTATATVTLDDHPADTGTTHQRVVSITQHITPSEPDRSLIAYMIATRVQGTDRWQVSMVSPH